MDKDYLQAAVKMASEYCQMLEERDAEITRLLHAIRLQYVDVHYSGSNAGIDSAFATDVIEAAYKRHTGHDIEDDVQPNMESLLDALREEKR